MKFTRDRKCERSDYKEVCDLNSQIVPIKEQLYLRNIRYPKKFKYPTPYCSFHKARMEQQTDEMPPLW